MESKARQTSGRVPTTMDAVAWVRGVRDAMYEATRDMSRDAFAAHVARMAASVSVDRQPEGGDRGTG